MAAVAVSKNGPAQSTLHRAIDTPHSTHRDFLKTEIMSAIVTRKRLILTMSPLVSRDAAMQAPASTSADLIRCMMEWSLFYYWDHCMYLYGCDHCDTVYNTDTGLPMVSGVRPGQVRSLSSVSVDTASTPSHHLHY